MQAIKSQNGTAEVVDLPEPEIKAQHVKVRIDYSSVSIGTELLMIRTNPGAPLGYSATGIVMEVGEGVTHVAPGQRVACYGSPAHREIMLSPKHLTVPVPDGVAPEEAAFAGLGAIAVHALRQAELKFGETVLVVGVGILGQIIARIAHASNYQVIGLEPFAERRSLLVSVGIRHACKNGEEVAAALRETTAAGGGADAVLVCASDRRASLIDEALGWLRDRGRVVIVGDTGTAFDRDLLFAKEASVHISRAGGPGRYEPDYEQLGVDYPIGYVRWTEGRNVQDFLRMLQEKRIDIRSLISDRVSYRELPELYRQYASAPQNRMGIVVRFD